MSSLLHLLLTYADAVQPWFDPQRFGSLYGGIGGGALGLTGAFIGGFGSWAAQRGRHRGLVLGCMGVIGAYCLLSLLTGVAALILGQPYGIWYPLSLIGMVGALTCLGLIPMMRKRYSEAESRRMDAAALRRS